MPNSLPPRLQVTRQQLEQAFPGNRRLALAIEQVLQTLGTPGSGSVNSTGELVPFAGAVAPSGWLICDGSAIGRQAYPDLFVVIGTTWGPGDGASTFNLPDMRGRVPVGANGTFPLGTTGGAEQGTWSGMALEQDGGAPYALKQGATSGNHPSMPPYAALTWLIKT